VQNQASRKCNGLISSIFSCRTIIQFTDFGCKILSSGHELYANEELNLVIADLLAIATKLSHERGLSKDFEQICQNLRNMAENLLKRLKGLKIKGKNRVWESLRQAVQAALSKEEIAALQNSLSVLREALETRVLVSLRCVVFLYG